MRVCYTAVKNKAAETTNSIEFRPHVFWIRFYGSTGTVSKGFDIESVSYGLSRYEIQNIFKVCWQCKWQVTVD